MRITPMNAWMNTDRAQTPRATEGGEQRHGHAAFALHRRSSVFIGVIRISGKVSFPTE
jgi:hypothetical protein